MKSEGVYKIGAFRFDPTEDALTDAEGITIPLRPQSARVLGILAARAGQLVTKDELMEEVWAGTHVTDDSLVQCVSDIRKALGPHDSRLLTTVPKKGYRLSLTTGEISRRRLPTLFAVAALMVIAIFLAVLWTTRGKPLPERTTIAVLPFVNMSGDAEQDYLSLGIAEDLLTDLSKISALTVLSRSSTFGYRNAPEAAAKIAETFAATHVIDGSVQRDGNRIRVSVQLVDTGTGKSLWAERYDRVAGDIFTVQDDVRTQIVHALAVQLAPQEQERLRKERTADVSAYDLLLQGRFHEASLTQEGIMSALSFYKRAIERDPAYGDAYARIANMYDFIARYEWGDDPAKDRARAIEMAEKAIQLDPSNPFAHWALGRVTARLASSDADVERAESSLLKAIEIDPNYADAYAFLTVIHLGKGDPTRARETIEKAFLLNPDPPSWYHRNRGMVSYFKKDYDAAIIEFSIAAEQNLTEVYSHQWLAAAYALAGRPDDAEWEVVESLSITGRQTATEILNANEIIRHPGFREDYASGLIAAGFPE